MKHKWLLFAVFAILLSFVLAFNSRKSRLDQTKVRQIIYPAKPITMLDYHRIFYPEMVKKKGC